MSASASLFVPGCVPPRLCCALGAHLFQYHRLLAVRGYSHNMSLTPGSPPRTPRTPPYSPRTPLAPGSAPQTPTRNAPIPRPPSSPLRRPASQVSLRSAPSPAPVAGPSASSPASVLAVRRVSAHGLPQPGSAPGSTSALGLEVGGGGAVRPASTGPPGTPQKTRARDLLRKHYGLGMGPPPPLADGRKNQDPMDFGELVLHRERGKGC